MAVQRQPRIQHYINLNAPDFSPGEVARGGFLRIKRSAIYKWIKAGVIETVLDEFGHDRITREEIKRLQHLWKIDLQSTERGAQLSMAMRRERARIAANENAAKYTSAEIASRVIEGRHRHYAELVDPEHKLPPDELARMVKRKEDAQMARARLANQRKIRQRQHSQDSA